MDRDRLDESTAQRCAAGIHGVGASNLL